MLTIRDLWPAIGIVVTFGISLAHVLYQSGKNAARIESLEAWRGAMRGDMHEVSEKIGAQTVAIGQLETLIKERTTNRRRNEHPELN